MSVCVCGGGGSSHFDVLPVTTYVLIGRGTCAQFWGVSTEMLHGILTLVFMHSLLEGNLLVLI